SVVTPGTWTIEWLNDGENIPDFSNLTLFARDVVTTPIPEPETYALLLGGLGLMGFVARRRKPAA
ncbi:MAG: FxDxF family PEP-CTERM protein, partial [Caldimonas sp.]